MKCGAVLSVANPATQVRIISKESLSPINTCLVKCSFCVESSERVESSFKAASPQSVAIHFEQIPAFHIIVAGGDISGFIW